ncbi:hypothetical protein [Streptomyces sp. NPDC002250]|uniref:hypothetical protein n=1 Tax=Streptomyces sp. NPDC002250 TaxID=3364641 RepID=UPI0036A0FC97
MQISEMFRLVRGTGHILDVLDVLHRNQVALRIHDGAFSAMDLTARHPRTGGLLSTVKFMVQTLAAAGELQRDLQRELTYDGLRAVEAKDSKGGRRAAVAAEKTGDVRTAYLEGRSIAALAQVANDDHQVHEPAAPDQQKPSSQVPRQDPGQEDASCCVAGRARQVVPRVTTSVGAVQRPPAGVGDAELDVLTDDGQLTPGPFLRRVDRHGNIGAKAAGRHTKDPRRRGGITADTINDIVKAAVRAAELTPTPTPEELAAAASARQDAYAAAEVPRAHGRGSERDIA